MDISTKNLDRIKAHADALRYQWADKDSEYEAHVAARARYHEHMKAHGYEQPEEDKPAVVEYAASVARKARMLRMRLMGAE